ncbi:MAG: hypothetical protein AAFN92_16050, partial [Bacteroidota bacterium]
YCEEPGAVSLAERKQALREILPILTFADTQAKQIRHQRKLPYQSIVTLGISHNGFQSLGISEERMVKDGFFTASQLDRSVSDNFGLYESGRGDLELNYTRQKEIDLLFLCANDSEQALRRTVDRLINILGNYSNDLRWFQEKGQKPNVTGEKGIFRFLDGVSNAVTEKDLARIGVKIVDAEKKWLGSFLVFQKIGVNNDYFEEMVQKVASEVRLPARNPRHFSRKEFAEALLLGRFTDGTPIDQIGEIEEKVNRTDFSFAENAICPYTAHVRAANLRKWSDGAADQQYARIIRRGTVFKRDGEGQFRKGLLFISLQKTLTQFRLLNGSMDKKDVLFYRGETAGDEVSIPQPWAGASAPMIKVERAGDRLSRLLGGENFFLPNKIYLKALLTEDGVA